MNGSSHEQNQSNAFQNAGSQINPNNKESAEQQAPKPMEIDDINPITLLKNQELFRQTFFDLSKLGLQFYRKKDFQKGLNALNKCIDMLDVSSLLYEVRKKYFKRYKQIYEGNSVCKSCLWLSSHKEIAEMQQILLKNKRRTLETDQLKEKYLKLSKFLVTLKFQHCAIVSQLEQHDKALEMCKSTLPELKKQIQLLLLYLQENSASRLLEKKSGQTVQFSKHVHKFAESTLNQLIRFLNEPLKKSHFYYWQKNPQQNQEQVRKKFIPNTQLAKQDCKRSILGVSKSTHWIDQFNIGSIMHMSMVTVDSFQTVLPMQQYLFKDKLYQLVILCSLSYFTMATQIRFIQPLKDGQKQKQKQKQKQRQKQKQKQKQKVQPPQNQADERQNHNDPQQRQKQKLKQKENPAEQILKKYGYEQKSQLFKLSELYHLRSIEIVSRNIQTMIPYLMHIIKSYDKHYLKKKELQAIVAINQESQIDMTLNQSVQEYLPEEKIYDNYMKKQSRNQQLMEELLLQSQNIYSPKASRNNGQNGSANDELVEVRNILDFSGSKQHSHSKQKKQKSDKSHLSKINQQPKLESQIHLYSRNKEGSQENSHEIVSSQYLQSVKTLQRAKSPQLSSHNKLTKRSKSKSKLNLLKVKSSQKERSSTSRSHKSIYTFGSPQHQHPKTSIYTKNENSQNFKKKNTDKSKQKIMGMAKYIQKVKNLEKYQPNLYSHRSSKGPVDFNPKQKVKHKKTQKQKGTQKNQKYYTQFDGQKEYRIKHESTTHIKVVYKKK